MLNFVFTWPSDVTENTFTFVSTACTVNHSFLLNAKNIFSCKIATYRFMIYSLCSAKTASAYLPLTSTEYKQKKNAERKKQFV